MLHQVFCIEWDEADPDLGGREDGFSLHLTSEDAEQFVREFWASKPDLTYQQFGTPSTKPFLVEVPTDVHDAIRESRCGIRKYRPRTAPYRRIS